MRFMLPLLLATLPAAASAQQQPASAAPAPSTGERMAPFDWLLGEWRGSGWTTLPDGSRHRFESHELVSTKLSGNALLIEGRHHEPGRPDRLVHDALALITWDNRASGYRFRSALANGMGGDFPVEPTPDGFTWRIDTPGGAVVYTVTHANGVWTERGRRTGSDGRTVDFFEMTLRRQ
jgi:hypothetical protein